MVHSVVSAKSETATSLMAHTVRIIRR